MLIRAGKSTLRADGREYGSPSGDPIVKVIMLPRKSAKLNGNGTRTVNGHTWSGRIYQGAWKIHG